MPGYVGRVGTKPDAAAGGEGGHEAAESKGTESRITTDSGNQSCPEASIPDLAVRIIRLFEELSPGSSESNLTLIFPF
jgi:hypothetical protein